MKYLNLKLLLIALIAFSSFSVIAQNSIPAKQLPTEKQVEKTEVEGSADADINIEGLEGSPMDTLPGETGTETDDELLPIATGVWAFISSFIDVYKDKGLKGALLWFITLLISARGTVKIVQLTRAWNWLKKFFYKTETENIVKGVAMLVSLAITLLTTGGEFDAMRYGVILAITLPLADVVYQFLKGRGVINKTPKAAVA